MKFQITLKDPDGVSDGLDEAAKGSVAFVTGLDEDERYSLRISRRSQFSDFAQTWLDYCEYVTTEFDTEAGTATVVKK
jgi:hypothetical protein